jgi:integrase
MTRPYQHPKTGVYWLRRVVPKELRPVIGKRELTRTLGTKDPDKARELAPAVLSEFAATLAAARAASGQGRPLTHREVMALCGAWYRQEVGEWEDSPGDPELWRLTDDVLLDKLYSDPETGEPLGYEPGERDLAEARQYLAGRGIAADAESVRSFARELFITKRKAAAILKRRAEGDYSPDPALVTFPSELEAKPALRQQDIAKPAARLTGEALLDAWAAENRPAPATRKKYAGAFRQVARVLGFDDVRRLTREEVVRFKEARLGEGRDPGTVADEMIALGTVCKWAVANGKVAENPFAGLAPKASRRGPKSRTPYTDEEAAAILKAARKEAGWRRWLPWLLAFSGARLSEVADMRRRDVRQDSGVWVLDFVPLPGRAGKNEIFQRMVPLHPAVIAEGFLDYLASLPNKPDGPLFPDLTAAKDGSRTIAATSAHGRWVRDVAKITGADKAPAHSWRHRMEDELRKVRALPEVVDAITGRYNARNAGAGYGKGFRGMPDETLKELRKVPLPSGVVER